MAINKVNTRVILKNDELSNWQSVDSVVLKKGELAFAKMENGKYEMRIGQGGKYDASAQLQLSASQIVGLNEGNLHTAKIYKVEGVDTTQPIEDIIAASEYRDEKFGPGDVFIAFNADGVASAYHYDETNGWIACEGNVDASKVIVTKDITLAGAYDRVGNLEVGGKVAKGTSVAKMFEDILDKTLSAELGAKPTASITLSNTGAKEIGSKFTPSWSVSYTQGKYNQPWDNSTVNDGTAATAYSITDGTSTSTAQSGTFAEFTVLSSTNYKVRGTVTYSDGNACVTNKGDAIDLKRTSATINASQSGAVTGAYPAYYAFTTTDKAAPTALTANNSNVTVDGVTYTRLLDKFAQTTFTADKPWYQLYYLVPTAKQTKTTWSGVDKNNVTLPTKASTTATVTFMNGTTAEYRVFIVSNAQPYSATTCTMKYA